MYRAVNGVEEAVWHKGVAVGIRVRHDNRLLFAMLRARDPLDYAPLDELERWEARRVAAADPHALADELEREEEAEGRERIKRTNALGSASRRRKDDRDAVAEEGENSPRLWTS